MAILVSPREQKRRSITKTISWRIVGSIDTALVSFVVTTLMHPSTAGDIAKVAGMIGLFEIPNKLLLFYIHERIWGRLKFGLQKQDDYSI